MILVVASRVDDAAAFLAAELPAGSAALLTCADLSLDGWSVGSPPPEHPVCIAAGQRLDPRAIRGVVSLAPAVFEQELIQIEPPDRTYVAAEMTAFLVFWLASLDCPKLNPPAPGCLSSPHWPAERWVAAAAGAGLPIEPLRRSTRAAGEPDPPPEESLTMTVVGRRCLGPDRADLRRWARVLADAAEVGLLRVRFVDREDGPRFCDADPFADLSQPGAADAVGEFFNSGGRR